MNSNATAAHSDLINVLLPCHLQFIPICLYLKIQWYISSFSTVVPTDSRVFSNDKFMKIFENYHEFGDTYFAQCFGINQYENRQICQIFENARTLNAHFMRTHILCEHTFHANKRYMVVYAKPM